MQSQTYKDIIDEKTFDWRQNLEKIGKMTERATAGKKNLLTAKIEALKVAIDTAIEQLHNLDAQETPQNTMETKDQILKILSSIDKELIEYQEKTPFML